MPVWLDALAVVFGIITLFAGLILVTDDRRPLRERVYGLWLVIIGFLCTVGNAIEFWAH